MAVSSQDLYTKALSLSTQVDENFLELASSLRKLQDKDPDLFRKLTEKADIGKRKLYYLLEISRTFDALPVSKSRLRAIGWTKLMTISKHVTVHNLDELLELAEGNTNKDLETIMRGDNADGNSHCVLLYFSPKEYKVFQEALVQHGGTRSGRGIQNKEKAIMRLIKKSREADEQLALHEHDGAGKKQPRQPRTVD